MKQTRMKLCFILILVVFVSSCSPKAIPPAESSIPEQETIVQALAESLNMGDANAAMALISEDIVFTMNYYDETLKGPDQVKTLFDELVAGNFGISIKVKSINDNTVTTETLTWGEGMPPMVQPMVAEEIYVVEDGKIRSITWSPNEESAAKMTAAITAMQAESIVLELADTLNTGNIDGAMDLIDENITFKMNFYDETLEGSDQVRALFEELVAGNFRISLKTKSIENGTVTTETLTWGEGMPPQVQPMVAEEIYVIEDGKISRITWTPNNESVEKMTAAMEEMEE